MAKKKTPDPTAPQPVVADFVDGPSAGRHALANLTVEGDLVVKTYEVTSGSLSLVRRDTYQRVREATDTAPARYAFVESRTTRVE